MPHILGFGGQKGGTGKTVLATTAAVEGLKSGLNVIVYDLDHTQQSAVMWAERRKDAKHTPDVEVKPVTRSEIPSVLNGEDISILDMPGFADAKTASIARHCHLFVLPTGTSLTDLDTTILVAHELAEHGVAPERLYFAITKAPDEASARKARDYIHQAGYNTIKSYSRFAKSIEQGLNAGMALTEINSPKLQAEAVEMFQSVAEELTRERQIVRTQSLDNGGQGQSVKKEQTRGHKL